MALALLECWVMWCPNIPWKNSASCSS